MNAQTEFAQGREIITPVQIAEICDGRDKAIALWLQAYDDFHETTTEAGRAMIGAALALSIPEGGRYDRCSFSHRFAQSGDVEEWDNEHRRRIKRTAREAYREAITAEIDRRCWDGLHKRLGFDELLDRQGKEEFAESLKGTPPEFTPENCTATFGHLWENRRELWLRGIANAFSALDRRFRPHDGFKIGGRMIIERALNEWGTWNAYEREMTLRDVERVFYELDEKAPPESWDGIGREIAAERRTRATPFVVNGDYFRVRVFGNGNLHLWFERDDLLREVNKLLAEYYGEAIGDGYDTTEAEDAPEYHVTQAKNFGAFNTSPEIANKVLGWANIGKGSTVLEPSAGTGVLAKAARDAGAHVTCIEIQDGLAHELAAVHGFQAVYKGDFLKVQPGQIPQFDCVLMNPPFDRGRDCDHVRHAWQFVKPGGELVAIMSARAEYGEDKRHKALHKIVDAAGSAYGRDKWHDLPPGSFSHAGTNVNTVVLTLRKPREN